MLSSHNFHMYSMLCPSPPTAQLEARESVYSALEKSSQEKELKETGSAQRLFS